MIRRFTMLAVTGCLIFNGSLVKGQDKQDETRAKEQAGQAELLEVQGREAGELREREALNGVLVTGSEVEKQRRACVQLQQLVQQMAQHQNSLRKTLETMASLENQTLQAELPTRQELFESAEQFGRALKKHLVALEKETEASGINKELLKESRLRPRRDAISFASPARDSEMAAKDLASKARADLNAAQKAAELAVLRAVEIERKLAEEYLQQAEKGMPLIREGKDLRDKKYLDTFSETYADGKWAEIDSRLERIEKALEKLAAEKE